jgi:hypothetical protein
MATAQQFSAMLKEYNPLRLIREEIVKRDWFLSNVEKDDSWKDNVLNVPFQGAKASSIQGGIYVTNSDNIVQSTHVKGQVNGYKELWGSMVFNDRDLAEHGNMERSFLKIMPDELDQFVRCFRERISLNLQNGPWIDRINTAVDSAAGIVVVDRPERFEVGMKVVIEEYAASYPTVTKSFGNASAPSAAYDEAFVGSINMNTAELVIEDENGNPLDLSTATGQPIALGTTAPDDNPRIYHVGGEVAGNQFTDLRRSLLSATNGGTTTLYGQTKTDYPYLQALNHDGSGITTTNILDKIFEFQVKTMRVGKGSPDVVVMSHDNMGAVKKTLEVSRTFEKKDQSVNSFGWSEVTVGGPKGDLKLVAINEMDNDFMPILDMRSMKVYSNGLVSRRKDPDGKEFFTERTATGFRYIVDYRFYGDLIVYAPSYNGIIHSVPNVL